MVEAEDKGASGRGATRRLWRREMGGIYRKTLLHFDASACAISFVMASPQEGPQPRLCGLYVRW